MTPNLKPIFQLAMKPEPKVLLLAAFDAGPFQKHDVAELAREYGIKPGIANRNSAWLHHYGWNDENSGDVLVLSDKALRVAGIDPIPEELLEKPEPNPLDSIEARMAVTEPEPTPQPVREKATKKVAKKTTTKKTKKKVIRKKTP